MTKDGRPSLLFDIRLFEKSSGYLKEREAAVAFARRLAWALNAEDVSLGTYHSLYIIFDPASPAGMFEEKVNPSRELWWQREIRCGIAKSVLDDPSAEAGLNAAIVEAVKAAQPRETKKIDEAARLVRDHGTRLRFPIVDYVTKRFGVRHSAIIEQWTEPSKLIISLTEIATGQLFEAKPILLSFYGDAFSSSRQIKLSDRLIQIVDAASRDALETADPLRDARGRDILRFAPAPSATYTKTVRPLGAKWP